MQQSFYSNGKLMITGEYTVLAGATALAVPAQAGQTLEVDSKPHQNCHIIWHTHVEGKHLLSLEFTGPHMHPGWLHGNRMHFESSGNFIRRMLLAAQILNPDFPNQHTQYEIKTHLDFSLHWGLGSSSSLISNVAWWAGVDPFELLFKISGGSGYDVACARSSTPILYAYRGKNLKPMVEEVRFAPLFAGKLAFIYSGRKQDSEDSVRKFNIANVEQSHIDTISDISVKVANASDLGTFSDLLRQHELLTAGLLGRKPVQDVLFRDFKGMVKSLGAWGGDFMLAASDKGSDYIKNYFANKGLTIIIPYKDMVSTPT